MNIQTLVEKIKVFEKEVVESGFIRDVQAYQTAISQPDTQNNLVQLKDIADKLADSFKDLEEKDFESEMMILFPKRRTFIDKNHLETLDEILKDTSISPQDFYSKFSSELTNIINEVTSDNEAVKNLKKTFSGYIESEDRTVSEENKAIMALVFKDLKTTGSVKHFASALTKWNKILLLYHQLVDSESPKEIHLVEVQNGSIEVIFDIKAEVAIDLVRILEIAFQLYVAFLAYKVLSPKRADNLLADQKISDLEKQIEERHLKNILEGLVDSITRQHKERKKANKDIDGTSIPVKAKQVAQAVVEHMIKGNEIKLLAAPKQIDEEGVERENSIDETVKKLQEKTQECTKLVKQLDEADLKLLTTTYVDGDDAEDEAGEEAKVDSSK